MKKFKIVARLKKRKKFVKVGDIGLPEFDIPNLTKDVTTDRPNHIWRTDFTYLTYRGIVFYLATVIDDFTKEIVWYTIGTRHTKEFVLEALKDAIRKTKTKPEIIHSDQWSEYRSFLFLEFLIANSIRASMSAKSSPWQNGWQESYYGKFKLEMDHLNRYESFEILIEAIHHQIYYYNYKRIHTTLRMPPVTFRESYNLLFGGTREEKREEISSLGNLNIVLKRVETGVS